MIHPLLNLKTFKTFFAVLILFSQLLTPALSYADASVGRRSIPDFYEDIRIPTAVRKVPIQAGVSVQAGVNLRAATQGDVDFKQVVLQGAATAAASGLASLGAKAIGDLYQGSSSFSSPLVGEQLSFFRFSQARWGRKFSFLFRRE